MHLTNLLRGFEVMKYANILQYFFLFLFLGGLLALLAGCSYGTYINNERGSYPNQVNGCEKEKR